MINNKAIMDNMDVKDAPLKYIYFLQHCLLNTRQANSKIKFVQRSQNLIPFVKSV